MFQIKYKCVLWICELNFIANVHALNAQIQRLQRANNRQKQQIDDYKQQNSARQGIFRGLNQAQRDRLRFEATKRKMEKAYQFKETYDGTPGEAALKFRRSIIAFDTKVQNRLGDLYSEEEVIDIVRNSMTGKAKEAVSQDIPQLIDDLYSFLESLT